MPLTLRGCAIPSSEASTTPGILGFGCVSQRSGAHATTYAPLRTAPVQSAATPKPQTCRAGLPQGSGHGGCATSAVLIPTPTASRRALIFFFALDSDPRALA